MKERPLKIAQVIASKGWGGRETVPLWLAGVFRRKGHAVSFWSDPDTRMGKEVRRLGFPLRPLRYRSHLDPRAYQEAARALQEDAPDILHVHHSRDLWTLVPVLRWKGWKGPLLLTKHIESSVSKKDPLHAFLYDRVDLLLGCSTMVRDNVRATCPVEPSKVGVAHPPVGLSRFRPNAKGRLALRRKWKAGKDPVVGMVARLSPNKGHELILRTAALLVQGMSRVRFKIAGGHSPEEVEYVRGLEALRDSLGLRGRFDFEGYVDDIPAFLSGLDLAVHTAPFESFGMAIVEAMACGTPVLARKGGGVADIFPAGKSGGKMIDSEDPAFWAREIGDLLKRPAHLRAMGRRGLPNAARFSLERSAGAHLDLYREWSDRKGRETRPR